MSLVERVPIVDGPTDRFFFRQDDQYVQVWTDPTSDFAPGAWALNADGPHSADWFQGELLEGSVPDEGETTSQDLQDLAKRLVRAQVEGPGPDAPLIEYSVGVRSAMPSEDVLASMAQFAAEQVFSQAALAQGA